MNAIHYTFAATLTVVFVAFCVALVVRLIKSTISDFKSDEDEPEYVEDELNEYFFLYADNKRFPYKAGWTRVLAPDFNAAEAVFNAYHPGTVEGLTNCATVYEGELFRQTNIFKTGNYGEFEHETIAASRMKIIKKGDSQCRPES